MKVNSDFLNLHESYLFARVAEKVDAYRKAHPERELIRLSIGDVTLPLSAAVISAMREAAEELGRRETFHGYGPESTCYGYEFLIDAIKKRYAGRGVTLQTEEIFISDGAKSDLGNLLDLFSKENTVLLPDPVYPAYADANVMDGREILYMGGKEENGFLPAPEEEIEADIIYLCSPNNPTGAVYSREQLKAWVEYARSRGAVILFDAAYEFFIEEDAIPHSIFEIEGAKECAIEICSFSKTAGFTGVRCGYTVVPKELIRERVSLNALWRRRQTTKFNGASYLAQRGAAAAFTQEGMEQLRENLFYYRENARLITECLGRLGIYYTGGKNSPYIWLKCPQGLSSWRFFDVLLERANVVGTPGCGFGKNGEGFFRLTAFGARESTLEACRRIEKLLGG